MRFGYWLPVFGGWLRNVEDERMEAEWSYVRRLALSPDCRVAGGGGGALVTAAVQLHGQILPSRECDSRTEAHPPAAPDGVRRRRVAGGEIADCPILRRVPHAWRPTGARRGKDQRHAGVARDERGGARASGLWSRRLRRVPRHGGRCPS